MNVSRDLKGGQCGMFDMLCASEKLEETICWLCMCGREVPVLLWVFWGMEF
jgi:hypothetical protein